MSENIFRIFRVLFIRLTWDFLEILQCPSKILRYLDEIDFPSLRLGLQNRYMNWQVGKHTWGRLAWLAIRQSNQQADNARYM